MRISFVNWWYLLHRRYRLPIFDIELANICSPTFRIVIAIMGFQMSIYITTPRYWFRHKGGKGVLLPRSAFKAKFCPPKETKGKIIEVNNGKE